MTTSKHGNNSKDHSIPLNIWSDILTDARERLSIPLLLVQRILAVYSQPKQRVLLAISGHQKVKIERTAAELNRSVSTFQPDNIAESNSENVHLVIAAAPFLEDSRHYRAWRERLVSGGILAVVAAPLAGPEAASQPGRIVEAAQEAGLHYLQHIIALTIPLDTVLQESQPGISVGKNQSGLVHRDLIICSTSTVKERR